MGHGKWMYRNGEVHEMGEDGLLQRERIILRYKTR